MIQEFVDARAEGLKAINTTTINMYRDKISEAISDGYKNTFTPQQFAKAVKEAISDTGEVRKNQARTIARTETGIISSTARQEAFEDEGFTLAELMDDLYYLSVVMIGEVPAEVGNDFLPSCGRWLTED